MCVKFTINCVINSKTCNLNVASKKLSNAKSYYLYKDGRWIAIVSRFDGNTYKAVSYLKPVSQYEVDAIGKQIDEILSGVETII